MRLPPPLLAMRPDRILEQRAALDAATKGETMADRPDHVKPPAYLSKSPPVPQPGEGGIGTPVDENRLDPTRYGDWENKGIAVDF